MMHNQGNIHTPEDLDEGELKQDSMIRADKIYNLSQAIVLKKFSAVKKEVMQLTNSEYLQPSPGII